MEDVAPRRWRSQKSPIPLKRKRSPPSSSHLDSKREGRSVKKKRVRKSSPSSSNSSPSSESSSYSSKEPKRTLETLCCREKLQKVLSLVRDNSSGSGLATGSDFCNRPLVWFSSSGSLVRDSSVSIYWFGLVAVQVIDQHGARLWFDDFGAQSRDVCYDVVKEAFLAHYKHVEDASDVWHQLETCLQKENECVDAYAWRFSQLWNRWCIALRGQVPPFMLKKYHFVVDLKGVLKLKVECKRPQNYEDALRIAKDKEWKLKHQQAGVFGNTSMLYGLGNYYGNVNHAPYASSEVKMDSLFVKSEPMPQISSPIVVMGHCVDAIKGVHDVHVDEIEAHVPIEEEKDMANALVANHVEKMPIILNVVEYEHEESVAKNVACDEVSFGLWALDVDNRLISGTMDVFGVALSHVLLDFMARSMVALVLYDGLCYICGLQQVYNAFNKKQGTGCIVDDDDWGFDDPAVEMNEEMQPFVDAALGRIWVMREQQSHEVVMNSSEAIHMYGREGGSDVCVGFDYGLANIEIERNLWDMFTMEVLFLCGCFILWPFDPGGC
ncbi:hypothetical protein L7F22_042885 [Adiantum nelumboides]|nr:hypothetical protein [Adiantum nelumboides]